MRDALTPREDDEPAIGQRQPLAELVVGQVLNINTGDLAVDSYTGKVSDPAVAEFVQGREESSATFNPGVTALAEGSTEVEMTNAQGGIQPLVFTVEVSER